MDKKKDYISKRVSQKDIHEKGRYVPDRHSRLAEQNARLEKTARRSQLLMLITFVVAMLIMGLPTYHGIRDILSGKAAPAASSAGGPAEAVASVSSSSVISASGTSVSGSTRTSSGETVASGSETLSTSSGRAVASSSGAVSSEPEKNSGDTAVSSSSAAAAASSVSGETASSSSEKASDAPVSDEGETGPADTGDSNIMLDTTMGPMLYYSQDDSEWADYLWGGTDPLSEYGCGPTTVAMIANSFSGNADKITPVMAAEWGIENGDFAQGSGSYNALIPDGIAHFGGLTVESMQNDMSADAITNALKDGSIMVALVGPGYFTQDGHFIVICSLHEDGSIGVADCKSMQRTQNSYSADFLAAQLYTTSTNSGGPLWKVSRANT